MKNKEKQIFVDDNKYVYKKYQGEQTIDEIISIMSETLSEPYPIYTYRYFLNTFPDLCIMVYDESKEKEIFIGGIVAGVEITSKSKKKGYIAMIAVKEEYRGKGIAQNIVNEYINIIKSDYNLDEIYLETEVDNLAALKLYEGIGFVKVKLKTNYYLNGKSAYRLKYWLN